MASTAAPKPSPLPVSVVIGFLGVMAVGLAGCASGTPTAAPSGHQPSTQASSGPATSAGTPSAGTSSSSAGHTSSPAPTTTTVTQVPVPAITTEILPTGVVLTLSGRVSGLPGRVADAGFASPTEFDFVLTGITAPGSGTPTTAPTGLVREVDLVATATGTQVRILLRSAASQDQIAVGAGAQVQVTLS